jgi:hypothetical protein
MYIPLEDTHMSKLYFVLLEDVKDVNTFYSVEQFKHQNGNAQPIYFRLMKEDSGTDPEQENLRWIPSKAANVVVHFDNLDKCLAISRVASNPFDACDDRSVWMVQTFAGDILAGNMTVTLTDGVVIQTLLLHGRLVCSSGKNNRFYA